MVEGGEGEDEEVDEDADEDRGGEGDQSLMVDEGGDEVEDDDR